MGKHCLRLGTARAGSGVPKPVIRPGHLVLRLWTPRLHWEPWKGFQALAQLGTRLPFTVPQESSWLFFLGQLGAGFKALGQLPGPAAVFLSLSIGIKPQDVVHEEVVLIGAGQCGHLAQCLKLPTGVTNRKVECTRAQHGWVLLGKEEVLAGRTADAKASSQMLEMAVTTVACSPS